MTNDARHEKKLTVSVVVPVYNSERYIEECVRSIQGQTYNVSEIFLIDDGSTDSSLQIIEKLALKDERIKIVTQKNSGPSKARNVGMLLCNSDLVAFNDADDVWVSGKIENQIDLLIKEQSEMVFSNVQIIDEFGNKIAKHVNNVFSGSKDDVVKALVYGHLSLVTPTAVFFRGLIAKENLFNESIKNYEDLMFFVTIALKAKVSLSPHFLVLRRQHSASTSISLNVENVLNSMNACAEQFLRLGKKEYIRYFKSYCFFAIAHFFFRSGSKIQSIKYCVKSILAAPSFKNLALFLLLLTPFSENIFRRMTKLKL